MSNRIFNFVESYIPKRYMRSAVARNSFFTNGTKGRTIQLGCNANKLNSLTPAKLFNKNLPPGSGNQYQQRFGLVTKSNRDDLIIDNLVKTIEILGKDNNRKSMLIKYSFDEMREYKVIADPVSEKKINGLMQQIENDSNSLDLPVILKNERLSFDELIRILNKIIDKRQNFNQAINESSKSVAAERVVQSIFRVAEEVDPNAFKVIDPNNISADLVKGTDAVANVIVGNINVTVRVDSKGSNHVMDKCEKQAVLGDNTVKNFTDASMRVFGLTFKPINGAKAAIRSTFLDSRLYSNPDQSDIYDQLIGYAKYLGDYQGFFLFQSNTVDKKFVVHGIANPIHLESSVFFKFIAKKLTDAANTPEFLKISDSPIGLLEHISKNILYFLFIT